MWSIDPSSEKGVQIANEIQRYIQRKGFMSIAQMPEGRYLQFVKLPNGTIHHFELKLDPFSEEDVNNIVLDIKNKQQELISKAYDENGKLIKNKQY